MKKYLVIIFLLCTGASFAQPPRIDSMFVDESKSELHIYGDFGAAKGAVWVDSVSMPIKSWSNSYIITSIPDTGRGSSGTVVIGGRSYISIPRKLTILGGIWWHDSVAIVEHNGISGTGGGKNSFKFYFRFDLASILARNLLQTLQIQPMKISQFEAGYDAVWYDHHGQGEQWFISPSPTDIPIVSLDSPVIKGFHAFCKILVNQRTIQVKISKIKGISEVHIIVVNYSSGGSSAELPINDFSFQILLDSNYSVKNVTNFIDPIFGGYTNISATMYNPPPFQTTLALLGRPTLFFPLTNSMFSFRNGIVLSWDSLSLMFKYHIQVSTDSLFSQRSIDTIITLTTLPLPPLIGLTQYFWRVAGVNSDGESRWSDVWNFTTGVNADVQASNNSEFTLSSFPNPTSKELNISYSLPARGNARLILYNLEGRIIRENMIDSGTGEHFLKWDISQLPSGSYVLGLVTEKETKSEIIKIIR